MDAASIRGTFSEFFKEREHLAVASASLVAAGDPTLLFTSAGMVPFKPYFLQQKIPPQPRLTSIQKCFRTTDIDEVGDDSHLTFFEMMGNFSFGNYFKEDVQAWAWELITKTLQIPSDRLVTTVFTEDDEAYDNWRKLGVPSQRIFRYGEEQGNYWYVGEEGPCGPCSEIHYDMRPNPKAQGIGPADDESRFLEIWNLVFMEFQQQTNGKKISLPAKNIDTGAGLERWAMMLQEKDNLYSTDLFLPLLEFVSQRCGLSYESAPTEKQRALRVIAEHGRAMTFLVSDGVMPGNEGRGYVLRRLMRRALYMAHRLNIEEDLLVDISEEIRKSMGAWYPEIIENSALVNEVVQREEERFRHTLDTGHALLEESILPAIRTGTNISIPGLNVPAKNNNSLEVPGPVAFTLWDTYGFPPDLTREIAEQHGMTFDRNGFDLEMEQQRNRGKASGTFRSQSDDNVFLKIEGASSFSGHENERDIGKIMAIAHAGKLEEKAEVGNEVEIILSRTSFYPEGGGQLGDSGKLLGPNGTVIIHDTQSRGDLISHIGAVSAGSIQVGENTETIVDQIRRHDLMRNHTGTHLLHAALRHVLGEHVRQAGSLVAPDRLRFDYTQSKPPLAEKIAEVQEIINAKIRADIRVCGNEMPYEEAMKNGAMAIFGEKYGTSVRVVEICDPDPSILECFSKELCGGVHVPATGFIGGFQIISESSIGSGVRRIEALTGKAAEDWRKNRLEILSAVSKLTKSSPNEVIDRIEALLTELETTKRRLANYEKRSGIDSASTLIAKAENVNGIRVVTEMLDVDSVDALRDVGDAIRDQLESGVVVLGTISEGRPILIAMVTKDLLSHGLNAANLIKKVAKITQGGGGGSATMAQAGGKDSTKLTEALNSVTSIIRGQITN